MGFRSHVAPSLGADITTLKYRIGASTVNKLHV